ncbi:hypothetical protein EON83_30530 [bacterium]|nr:MAG: hypothetical protein EON83_30530 [bacterium]
MRLPSTLNVLMTLSILAAMWEMYTLANRQNGDTFSATIRRLGQNQPFIVFACGLIMGHLWWPLLDKEDIEQKP